MKMFLTLCLIESFTVKQRLYNEQRSFKFNTKLFGKTISQGVGDSTKRGKTSLKTQAFATKSERLPQNDPFATKMTRLPQNRGVFPSFPRFPTFCQLLIGLSRVTWSRGGGRPILKLPRALVGVGKGVRTRRKNG